MTSTSVTLQQAKQRVLEYLRGLSKELGHELALVETATIERTYGWVFFFNTQRFVSTGNPLDGLGGNGPIVVESANGHLHQLGTARPVEQELSVFEALHFP